MINADEKRKIIKRDEWDSLLDLTKTTKGNFANFEDDGSWNSIVDDFVAFKAK